MRPNEKGPLSRAFAIRRALETRDSHL